MLIFAVLTLHDPALGSMAIENCTVDKVSLLVVSLLRLCPLEWPNSTSYSASWVVHLIKSFFLPVTC